MFMLRGCTKCHGDLFQGEDIYGTYLCCVQCGRYYFPEASPAAVGREVTVPPSSGPPVAVELDLAA